MLLGSQVGSPSSKTPTNKTSPEKSGSNDSKINVSSSKQTVSKQGSAGGSKVGSKGTVGSKGSKGRGASRENVNFQSARLSQIKKQQNVRYVKAPKPLKPWERHEVAEKKKHHHHHSRLHHFLAQLHVVDESSSDSEDENHHHHNRKAPKSPKQYYCRRIMLPLILLTVGTTLMVVFIAKLVYIVPRKEGTCSLVGFQKGESCGDCSFMVKVSDVPKHGFFRVSFNDEGEAVTHDGSISTALAGCDTSSCCNFLLHKVYDIETWCDSAAWDCTYIPSSSDDGQRAEDIREGTMTHDMLLLYFSLIFFVLLLPLLYLWRVTAQARHADQLDDMIAQSRENMKQAEEDAEAERVAALQAQAEAAQKASNMNAVDFF